MDIDDVNVFLIQSGDAKTLSWGRSVSNNLIWNNLIATSKTVYELCVTYTNFGIYHALGLER